MAKHGTLVEFLCQRKFVVLDNLVTIIYGQQDSVEAAKTVDDVTVENEAADEEFVDEFDPSSERELRKLLTLKLSKLPPWCTISIRKSHSFQ